MEKLLFLHIIEPKCEEGLWQRTKDNKDLQIPFKSMLLPLSTNSFVCLLKQKVSFLALMCTGMQQSCQSTSPKFWVLACKAWPSVTPCRAGAKQCELSSYGLYGDALVVLRLFPTLTHFRCFMWRSHSNCGLTSDTTSLSLPSSSSVSRPAATPFPAQQIWNTFIECKCCGLRGSLPWGIRWLSHVLNGCRKE